MSSKSDPITAPVAETSALCPVTPHAILAQLICDLHDRLLRLELSLPYECAIALQRAHALAIGLDPYLVESTSQVSESLQALERASRELDWRDLHRRGLTAFELEAEMLCGSVEASFLAKLVQIGSARRVLEVGMFTGYSTLAMAESLPEEGQIISLEHEPWLAEFARAHFDKSGHGHKIEIRLGDAITHLKSLAENRATFDLIFIDAMKTQYIDYYQLAIEHLLAPNGCIAVDNTLMQGRAYCGSDEPSGVAIREFNATVARDSRVSQVLLPIRDGITLITRV